MTTSTTDDQYARDHGNGLHDECILECPLCFIREHETQHVLRVDWCELCDHEHGDHADALRGDCAYCDELAE